MAVLDNIIQGSFTSDGTSHNFNIRSDLDWIEVLNYTAFNNTSSNPFLFRWMRGMPQGSALVLSSGSAGAVTASTIATGGISLINTSDPQTPSALLSASAITNASPPVVSSSNTGSLGNGNIVEIINSATAPQLNGYQFTINTLSVNTSFNLAYMGAPGSVGGATSYRFFLYDPMFYPRRRLITNITQATQAVVTLSVTHGYTVGQLIVFNIPKQFGMTQLNGIRAMIVAINTTNNTITVNVDTSAMTAWTFPSAATAAAPFTPAQSIPFGDGVDPTTPLITSATLAGATQNQAIIGVNLGTGVTGVGVTGSNGIGPAGANTNLMYWRATKASQLQTTWFS